jgi:hypothetical protein
MISNNNLKIFESPDSGETVYVREIGSDPRDRVLHSESEKKKSTVEQIGEDQLWHDIRRAAKTNKTLQDALERAILIYQLSKENGTK